MLVEMRILVLDSGVLMWKVTLSKSETIWSMAAGVALCRVCGQSGESVVGAERRERPTRARSGP